MGSPSRRRRRGGIEIARRVRRVAPAAHVCFFGLYAALNAERLLGEVADSTVGGELEEALVDLAQRLARGERPRGPMPVVLRKLAFVVPRRDRLAPLSRYATFFGPGPEEIRKVGYVEASRGCRHTCRHCPVTPVYGGRFFVVPKDVVLADAEQQIAAGARHVTFGDPDFFNGPRHGLGLLAELHARHPEVSFDVTIKVEHLLSERARVADLGRLGVAFVVSAVESLSDEVLARLAKGHTRADVFAALDVCRAAGVALRPSFVAFTPWSTLDDYLELCEWIAREGESSSSPSPACCRCRSCSSRWALPARRQAPRNRRRPP